MIEWNSASKLIFCTYVKLHVNNTYGEGSKIFLSGIAKIKWKGIYHLKDENTTHPQFYP